MSLAQLHLLVTAEARAHRKSRKGATQPGGLTDLMMMQRMRRE